MVAQQLVLFVHVAAAIVLVGGMIGGNVIGAMARRAPGLEQRRGIVAVATPFEKMTTIAVPVTLVSGLVTLMLFGYSVTDFWVLGTGAVTLVLVAIQIGFWNKVGPQISDALERGDDLAAVRLMRSPRAVVIGRAEVALAFLIVALMVLRPNWPF